jgi:hypothetical protein
MSELTSNWQKTQEDVYMIRVEGTISHLVGTLLHIECNEVAPFFFTIVWEQNDIIFYIRKVGDYSELTIGSWRTILCTSLFCSNMVN